MMNILVGCECSGMVRDELNALGVNAWSCDLKPIANDRRIANHLHGDVRWALEGACHKFDAVDMRTGRQPIYIKWDAAIFHPDCTFLTNSAEWAYGDGPYHQKVKPETLVGEARREARRQAVEFVFLLRDAPIPKIAIENPRGHLSSAWRKPDQTIQPYEFGDDASKATCLWLKNLPLLQPTQYIEPTLRPTGKRYWANQTDTGQNRLSPSDTRAADRAQTYPGIARAMAQQWSKW